MMEDFTENLDQYVKEEKKISSIFRVLWAYAKKNPQVEVTYLVSGETATERIFRVVSAAELDEAKKALKRVTGVHVFSLQEQIPKDAAVLVAEDVALRRSMIGNSDALTHPLLDGRYSAVSFAEGQQLRRGGSGVRPEPAKTKSLPPPDTKSTMKPKPKSEKDKNVVAMPVKAQSAVASQFTVREGVQTVVKPKGLMSFVAKGSRTKSDGAKADDANAPLVKQEQTEKVPQATRALSVKEEKAKNFFAPKPKTEKIDPPAPAAAVVKTERDSSEEEEVKTVNLKASSKHILSDEEEAASTPLNASQRKRHIIQEDDEDDFFSPPKKVTTPPESPKKPAAAESKAQVKKEELKKSKKGEKSDNDSPKKKKNKKNDDPDKQEVKKERKDKKDKKKEKEESPKKGKKRKSSDVESDDGKANPSAAPATKSITDLFHASQPSQPSSGLSVGSGSQKRKVKQTRRYKNEKGYLVSETIEVEVDDDALPAQNAPVVEEKPRIADVAPKKQKGEEKKPEAKKEAKAEEPVKKVAQSNITNFFRKK